MEVTREHQPEQSMETVEWFVYCLAWFKDIGFLLLFAIIIMQGHNIAGRQYKAANLTSVLITTQYEILDRLRPVQKNGHDNINGNHTDGTTLGESMQSENATLQAPCLSHRPCRTKNPNVRK